MVVVEVSKDLEQARLTVIAEFDRSAERLWDLWADPGQLERWWGPPGYPATVSEHTLEPGGIVRYFMTGPEGDRHHGGWRVVDVAPPHRLEIEDFFADADGNPDETLPVSRTEILIENADSGITRMTMDTRYATTEALEKVLAMGMEDGIRGALGQIEGILAEG